MLAGVTNINTQQQNHQTSLITISCEFCVLVAADIKIVHYVKYINWDFMNGRNVFNF